MSPNRWKLMAGGLAVSLGGLAAVAGAQSQSGVACQMIPPQPVAVVYGEDCKGQYVPAKANSYVVLQPPVPATPAVPALPAIPEPVAAPPVPAVSTPGELPHPTVPAPVVQAAAKAEPAPAPRPAGEKDRVLEVTIPAAASEPAPPAPKSAGSEPKSAPAVPQLPTPTADPKPPTLPTAPPVPAAEKPTAGSALPAPLPVESTPQPAPAHTPPPADPLLATPPAPAPAPGLVEKKLKVMLHMGDDRPRFEVRDGDEVYLKVVCDRVDVKSPSDNGATMSTLKASGKVAYVTPGGEGVCDELTVIPGTGQVCVSGKVSFKYNWGKVETTVSGDKMTFRLGSAPGMAPTATPAAVPASYHQTR